MARGVNKVILIGNCGGDPETRYFPDGGAVTNVTLATSESWRDRQTGQMQERTEWHRVVFRDRGNFRLGQIAGEYIRKGSKIYVEGSLRTRQWEQDGVKRYTTEIVANEMQLLDSRNQQGGGQPMGGGQQMGGQPMGGGYGGQPGGGMGGQQAAGGMVGQPMPQGGGMQPQQPVPQQPVPQQQAPQQPMSPPPQQPASAPPAEKPADQGGAAGFDSFDDDIPF